MNIKRIIDKNGKSIFYIVIIIVFGFIATKSLNLYYEKDEAIKKEQIAEENKTDKETPKNTNTNTSYSTESKSIPKTISSFVNYCNKREIENAYKMLTEECKKAMFPTVEDFERIYINNVFNITRTYELEKWSIGENRSTYLITLYGDILATGGADDYTQDYYTLIKNNDGVYKLNINSYIYGVNKNLETTVRNIKIKIGNVDIYEEYEEATIVITNNSSKKICLTGNKYREHIYLKNTEDVIYSSLDSLFDYEELVIQPHSAQTYVVQFNKTYSSTNKAYYLVLSDVILDYDEYSNSTNKLNYSNRTSIKVQY